MSFFIIINRHWVNQENKFLPTAVGKYFCSQEKLDTQVDTARKNDTNDTQVRGPQEMIE